MAFVTIGEVLLWIRTCAGEPVLRRDLIEKSWCMFGRSGIGYSLGRVGGNAGFGPINILGL
jgi:hypothetical protein